MVRGVSKAVPILGGVVSGGITFATLRPMGQRLADTLDEAHFSYTEEEFHEDWEDIVEIGADYSIVEAEVPKTWIGKNLMELNPRKKYGFNVIAKKYEDKTLHINANICRKSLSSPGTS